MSKQVTLFWHRRDLRIDDNAGLYHALKDTYPVLPVFIFDTTILNELENKHDARVDFIYQSILALKKAYQTFGSDLLVLHEKPLDAIKKLVSTYKVQAVFTNRDYEPYAQKRDKEVYAFLKSKKIDFKGYKDHVIFEKNEVVKQDETPYTIFTPYAKKWKQTLNSFFLKSYPTLNYCHNLIQHKTALPPLKSLGFETTHISFPAKTVSSALVSTYDQTRNIPAIQGTSRLSVHLRFGTISIRKLARIEGHKNETFLNELIWRDFYQMILFHFPHTVYAAFKPAYDRIVWRNNKAEFDVWCNGQTGYPIVDAGMRELNMTGFMHNRVRMVVASFLTKHLLVDWRWGEAYFAKKLLDFDLASNIGGWQWAAGCGCDAAPYFRVFNPALQTQKFDPDLSYIRKWVPELNTSKYPLPIVDHAFARERVLAVFKKALQA